MTFTRWWNSWLVERQLTTDDLCEDIKLGVLPIELFEILSRSSCGRYVKAPKTSFQKLDNFNIFLEQLKSKSIKLANIGAEDLAGGVRKAVLGLTWTLILTYEVNKLLGEKAGINDLLNWVKEKVKPYGVILEVHDTDSTALDLAASKQMLPAQRLTLAFRAAEKVLGVPQLLDPGDFFMTDGKNDEKSIILYVAKLKQEAAESKTVAEAELASIEAMGFEAASEVAVAEASAKLAQRTASSHALDADREAAFAAAAAAAAQDAHRVVAVREAALTTAKARLHELRETLLSEVAELRVWLGVRMERYEQASKDPSKTLLGSTEDESRALLDSLKNDCLLELPARGDKRRELKERCVRLESMKAQYDIEMGIRTSSYITPPVGTADGGAKEAFATLDAIAQKSLQSRKDGTSAVTGASTGGDEVAREAAAMKELTRVTAERDEARAMVKALMKEGGSGRGSDGTERRDERSFCKAIATCFSPMTPAAPTIVPRSSPD
ncbi:actinin-type actin-binding conserved site [Chrysochromulina tobinii]|uniref:Actinin-type actin-binding conserved site n=1 Tax=Chrysochromulina tobinii TaxID=1460289 RepID=A0A0M0K0A6_9EUKA|nr:actinin-type actin-binding conserved site [Chrysochromulina tobinii]|eukprot:KOO32002.1 actinin-type actin-binding conserved site [Chrysochromulina sp. CCMP291]